MEAKLQGLYQIQGELFVHSSGIQLKLKHRKSTVSGKPPFYLVFLEGAKETYVSSLYPHPESKGSFLFDAIQGERFVKYLLQIDADNRQASILERPKAKVPFKPKRQGVGMHNPNIIVHLLENSLHQSS